MKVLITGASGFIGSRLITAACKKFGAENVIALSSKPIEHCQSILFPAPELKWGSKDSMLLDTTDTLIHVGAFTPKSSKQANSIEGCNGNIIFTEKLLQLPMKNLKKIVYISTCDVYEPGILITEDSPTMPTSLYGLSKLYCERLSSIHATDNGIDCQILRIGHVYGPGEDGYEKFLPQAIRGITTGQAVDLWGDGSEIRSMIYVDDVVKAILKATQLSFEIGPVNVVGGKPKTIRNLLQLLFEISGKSVTINVKEGLQNRRDFIFDNSKMRKYLLPIETDLFAGLKAEYEYVDGKS